jgi:RNA polymerase sigma factor (sigma-70 family)
MSNDITALYTTCRNDLVAYLAHMLSCEDTAEDIAQESFMVLAHNTSQTAIEHPRCFLFRIANNLAIDYLRHNKVVARHVENAILLAEEPQTLSLEQELSQAEWQALLKKTVLELPPRTRDAMILHKLRGLSYREVGEALGISESTVEKHISKGLLHCRVQLGNYFQIPYKKAWGK